MLTERELFEIVARPDEHKVRYTDETVAQALEVLFPAEIRPEVQENLDVFYTGDQPRIKLAILLLSDGDADQVAVYGEKASTDYRDVLYWVELKLAELND